MARTINLALYYRPGRIATADMEAIGAEIERLRAGVRPILLSLNKRPRWLRLRLLGRPTVSVEFSPVAHVPAPKAVRLQQLPAGKLGPSAVIRDAGLPIPRYAVIAPGLKLDPAEWGPYVVTKPDLGGRGAYVRIQKTGRVRWLPPEQLDPEDPGRRGARIVQRFIHTGPYPVAYRVLTLFGEPLAATRYEGRHNVLPLHEPDGFKADGQRPIVANAKGCTIQPWRDEEMLALARRVHALFPTVPLLGHDFVREAATGELYILEVNPNGAVWFFSNQSGRAIQEEFGFDLYPQFDMVRTAARTLVDVARRYGGGPHS